MSHAELRPPQRVRPSGDLFHRVLPAGSVYVGRPGRWGNPHRVGADRHGRGCRPCGGMVHTLSEAIDLYRRHLAADRRLAAAAVAELAGRDLACWCPSRQACHADLLLIVANGGEL